jgi:hypothetical protein
MVVLPVGGRLFLALLWLVPAAVTAFAPSQSHSLSCHQHRPNVVLALPSWTTSTPIAPGHFYHQTQHRHSRSTASTALALTVGIPNNPGIELAGLIYDSTSTGK